MTRSRRGLSSIVGALLFVVLMVAAFAVFGVALDSQTDVVDTGRIVADQGLKKQKENFAIESIIQLPGQNLEINMTNKGQNPTEIFTLVITNSSDITNGYPTKTIDIPSDTAFLPPNSQISTDIVKSLNLTMANSTQPELYQFKVISSLGNIQKLFVVCQNAACGLSAGGGSSGLFAQFLMDGPNAVNTKTSTAVMFVTNTGEVILDDVAPIFTCVKGAMFTVSPDSEGTADYGPPCDPDPLTIDTLSPGQTAIFKWDGVVTGEIDDEFTFCNQAKGIDPDLNNVFSDFVCDELTVIDPNDCGGCGPGGEGGETIILIDDLLVRPSIFMIIPSPMGDAAGPSPGPADQVMFGVNVVNPTNSTIDVGKVVISVFAPGANNNDKLFDVSGSGCEPTNIAPLGANYSDSDWSCPGENQLLWKDRDHPIILGPYSVETFMVKINIGGTGIDLEGVLIQTSVFTSFGSFGKGNYQTTMTVDKSPTMSQYMSPVVNSLDDANRLALRDDITHNQTQNFNIVLADTDLDSSTWLESGSRFIINVPREWAGVNVTGVSGVTDPPSVVIHSDGSTQIIGITNDEIGNCDVLTCGVSERQAATISFETLPPNKDIDRLYIMYVLADGEARTSTGNLFTSGPLNEIVLQVNSNSTSP